MLFFTYHSDTEKNNDILKNALQTSRRLGQLLSNMQDGMRSYFEELSQKKNFIGIQKVLVEEINNSDSKKYAILTTTDSFYRYKEAVKELVSQILRENDQKREQLDNLSIATIECSNQVGKGWKTQVDNSLSELKYVIGQKEETVLDVLKSWDMREPSNYNVFSGLRSRAEHLSKKYPDETKYLMKFLAGLHAGDFVSGAFGSGAAIQIDPLTGKSYFEVDEIFVRMRAVFRELIIESLHHIGGEMVLSPARMKCVRVEEQDDAYRCYFERGNMNDSGRYETEQEFTVGAQARCQVFTGNGQKYYWRLVTTIGEDYIDLSKTDCDTGSDIPGAGDDICQLGHRSDESGMNAIILSSYGPDAPSYKQYACMQQYVTERVD